MHTATLINFMAFGTKTQQKGVGEVICLALETHYFVKVLSATQELAK
ncbi:hypothetical protein ACTG16_23645 [Aeromonas sp. 23P]|nr:hypothetical protein [Aeromonas veronii]